MQLAIEPAPLLGLRGIHLRHDLLGAVQVAVVLLVHGDSEQPRFQPHADVEELLHFGPRQHRHIGSPVRDHVDQPFGAELADGLAHRQAADAQFLGKQFLAQRRTGRNCTGQDAVAQFIHHQIDGGLADQAAGGPAASGRGGGTRRGSGKR
ncbi:hypothetical protein D3C87_1305530 [compost metagenome]